MNLRGLWQRAEAARAARLISFGALAYLRTLVRLARERGDGQSFALGERVIEEITGLPRVSIRRWRAQLADAGLITFDRRWAHKQGWFWLARTTLLFSAAAGLKMSPVNRAQKEPSTTGPKKSPSLYREKSTGKGSGRGRRAGARGAGCAATATGQSDAPNASRRGGKPRTWGGGPPPLGQAPSGAPKDEKGAPEKGAPDWESMARRMRQIIDQVKRRPQPSPVEPEETH